MNTLSIDLDLNLSTDIPDLPPPWPSTDVAIAWWLNRTICTPSPSFEDRLQDRHREHNDAPFVLID